MDSRTNAYVLKSLGANFIGVTYDCAEVEDNIASLEYGAIIKNIIENYNGTITFNSELGKGTEFIVSFPITK